MYILKSENVDSFINTVSKGKEKEKKKGWFANTGFFLGGGGVVWMPRYRSLRTWANVPSMIWSGPP
jgi:hypothetical protein